MSTLTEVRVIGLPGMPEVQRGDELAPLILECCRSAGCPLIEGDILVVTQKIVSKSEGRQVDLRTIVPSAFAFDFAERHGKDPRHVEVVLRESARIVRMDRGLIIAETQHGLVCANAGVDASNVPGDETVCLLPVDPDSSAAHIRREIAAATGFDAPVIITDSFGRPWRDGITNVAIGLSGMLPLSDYRGQVDDHGMLLNASVLAVADEIAAASELVMGKLGRRPVAIVRGYPYIPGEGTARELRMQAARDLFR